VETTKEIKDLCSELKNYYGISFNLDESYAYEIIDDMDNIEAKFSELRNMLIGYK